MDWLNTKLAWTVEQKRAAIEPDHAQLSVHRQWELVGLARSSYYYRAAGESAENLALLRWLDEPYTRTPFYGVRRMTAVPRGQGLLVNPKRVRRLLRTLGLEALYPRPRTSVPAPGHRTYPYLLRGLRIERPNQVWTRTLPTSACAAALSIWSRCSTGSAAMCWPGSCPTAWTWGSD